MSMTRPASKIVIAHLAIIILHFAIFFAWVSCANAQNAKKESSQAAPVFGLAMHGDPKYGPESKHVEYANPAAPKGGTLKTGVTGTFDTLNPFTVNGVAAQGLSYYYDRLMARVYDEPFTLYPLIAEKAEIAPDRSSVTFTLNPAARFHDGTPITADDVIFSFETLREHGRPNMRRIYKLVDKAEKKDERTVYFHFGPGYDRETVMIMAMMPVLSKKWWQGRKFDETLLTPPLSNGPYKIKLVEAPKRIIYERVKDYWAADLLTNAGHNNFDTLVFDYYRDDNIALAAFKKGDLNVRREFDLSKWYKAYADLDLTRFMKRDLPHARPERVQGFIMNLRRPPLDDIKVRQALALAFDGGWVGQNLFFGAGKRIDSFFPNSPLNGGKSLSPEVRKLLETQKTALRPAVFHEDPGGLYDTRPLRQRLKQAGDLLDKAGWVIRDGMRVNKSGGQPLRIEAIVNEPQMEKTAINYKKTLKKLGVDLNIRLLDAANFARRRGQYDFDILMLFWMNSLSPGTEQMIYWGCEAAKQPMGLNYAGTCNPALEVFAKGIAGAKTYGELTAYAQAIDRILLAEYIIIPLFYTGLDYIAYDRTVHMPEKAAPQGIIMETLWMEDKSLNPQAKKTK